MAGRSVLPLFYESWGAPRLGRGSQLAGPLGAVGAAAVRIPEKVSAQLALLFPSSAPQIFIHEGARQALERRLTGAFPGPVVLSITDNRHSIISHRLKDGVLRVRLHHMFLDAPAPVIDALVRYIVHDDRDASANVGHYIEANGARLAKRSRNLYLVTQGRHHDLLAIYDELNTRYFDGTINALITWGKRVPKRTGRARSTIKLGSYSAAERLVRIHPALDRTWVPRYFVAYIVYHEMLHHAVPASRGEGRLLLHPLEFCERERQFRHYARAIEWEKRHIARLLRS